MGSFFTNVQVFKKEPSTFDRVVQTLIATAEADGMVLSSEQDADGDRSVVVVDSGRWVSVFDEGTEDQSADKLHALAASLSRAVGAAFSVLVHDSDVAELGLFDAGVLVDRYNSYPAYFSDGAQSAEAFRDVAGKPALWAPMLAAGRCAEDLAACWRSEAVFAERTVAAVADLLGCPPDLMTTGYRYLGEQPLPDGARVLHFFLKHRTTRTPPSGPPRLKADVFQAPWGVRLAAGDELRISLSCRNEAGSGKGLQVTAWGEAVDRALVEIEHFELLLGDPRKGARHQLLSPAVEKSEGRVVLSSRLEDAPIPTGTESVNDLVRDGMDFLKATQVVAGSSLHVNVVGKVVAAGSASLAVALSPLENQPDGAVATEYTLRIEPKLSRPLRSPANTPSHLLRPLATNDFLIGMVVFDREVGDAIEVGCNAFERVCGLVEPEGSYQITTVFSDSGRRPRVQKAKARRFFKGKKWAGLREVMRREAQVQVHTEQAKPDLDALMNGEPPNRFLGGCGFLAGGSIVGPRSSDDPECGALCWWADVSSWKPDRVAVLRKMIEAGIEEVMNEQGGIQGFVTRWGQLPPLQLDTTHYEAACGVEGTTTLLCSWARRWLRAIGTEVTYVGTDLRGQLGADVERTLEENASVDILGTALRVRLKSLDGLSGVERALEALLPSADDFQRASSAYYEQVRRERAGR